MGSRLLRVWLRQPLMDIDAIRTHSSVLRTLICSAWMCFPPFVMYVCVCVYITARI